MRRNEPDPLGGGCCGTIGSPCSQANPCCGDLQCASFCCKPSLEPCIRDEDCCNRACVEDGAGQKICAFF